jgi:tetratricopeptide (TPR) repeat protein
MPGSWDERLHAMDYLAYGYLQTGRDADSKRVLDTLDGIERVDPPNFKVAFAATAIPARYLLERRQWRAAAELALSPNVQRLVPWDKFRWAQAHVHLARAVGAARIGDVARAREETGALSAIEQGLTIPPGEYDWRTQVSIQRQIAQAWTAFSEGRRDQALATIRAAADLDDATEKHPVTPGALLPAREQLGELLLETGRPAEALVAFEQALRHTPRRPAALYGALRAAGRAGDQGRANRLTVELLDVVKNGDHARPEFQEAKRSVQVDSTK